MLAPVGGFNDSPANPACWVEIFPKSGVVPSEGVSPFAFYTARFDEPIAPDSGCAATGYTDYGVTSTASPISGQVDFVRNDGTPLCMSIVTIISLPPPKNLPASAVSRLHILIPNCALSSRNVKSCLRRNVH